MNETKLYRIKTYSQIRRGEWYSRFGVETLPVKYAEPRPHELPGKTVIAYDLDPSRLSSQAMAAFAHRLARANNEGLEIAKSRIDGYPIPALNCTAIEEADAAVWREQSLFAAPASTP